MGLFERGLARAAADGGRPAQAGGHQGAEARLAPFGRGARKVHGRLGTEEVQLKAVHLIRDSVGGLSCCRGWGCFPCVAPARVVVRHTLRGTLVTHQNASVPEIMIMCKCV